MAGTLTYRLSLFLTENSINTSWRQEPATKTVAVAGSNRVRNSQTLSTSAEALALSEVDMGGMWMLHNTSSTAGEIIHLRDGSGGANIITLNPGEEQGPVRLGAGIAALNAIAAAGTPTLEYWGFDP